MRNSRLHPVYLAKQDEPFHGTTFVGFSLQEDFYDYQIGYTALHKPPFSLEKKNFIRSLRPRITTAIC